jgi:hypothetical protein
MGLRGDQLSRAVPQAREALTARIMSVGGTNPDPAPYIAAQTSLHGNLGFP